MLALAGTIWGAWFATEEHVCHCGVCDCFPECTRGRRKINSKSLRGDFFRTMYNINHKLKFTIGQNKSVYSIFWFIYIKSLYYKEISSTDVTYLHYNIYNVPYTYKSSSTISIAFLKYNTRVRFFLMVLTAPRERSLKCLIVM